jgi:hypothetical protein
MPPRAAFFVSDHFLSSATKDKTLTPIRPAGSDELGMLAAFVFPGGIWER